MQYIRKLLVLLVELRHYQYSRTPFYSCFPDKPESASYPLFLILTEGPHPFLVHQITPKQKLQFAVKGVFVKEELKFKFNF